MLRCWIRYLILLGVSTLLYVFYVGYVSWFLFVLVCFLPIFSLCFFFLAKRKFTIQLCAKPRYQKQEQEQLKLLAKTDSIIPLACAMVEYTITNHFYQETQKGTLRLAADKTFSEIDLPYPFTQCGKVEVTIDHVEVYDFLGLFHMKKAIEERISTVVYPPNGSWKETVFLGGPQEEDGEALQKSNIQNGDSFDVHSYRPGDSLHRVHWKLSAKMDDIMVREFALPKAKTATIYFEFYGSKTDCEEILCNVYHFSTYLLDQSCIHEIILVGNEKIRLQKNIHSMESLNACMDTILAIPCLPSAQPTSLQETHRPHTFYMRKEGLWKQEKGDEQRAHA